VCAHTERRVRGRIAGDENDVTRKVAEIADAVEHRTVHQKDGWDVPYVRAREELVRGPPGHAYLMFAERVWIRTRATEDVASVRGVPVILEIAIDVTHVGWLSPSTYPWWPGTIEPCADSYNWTKGPGALSPRAAGSA
jgi:1-acyl-sn-glycerol-3-phosphate acyltransferase